MAPGTFARLVQLAGVVNILTGLLPPRHGRMAALAEAGHNTHPHHLEFDAV